MAYTKTTWVNEGPPAIDADNLNKIEQGIYYNDQRISAVFFEEGTEGAWSYRKYADGTFEAWCTDANNVAVQNAWGSLYANASAIQITLPSFADPSGWSVFYSINGGELIRIVTKSSVADPPYFTYSIISATSRSASARIASFYVKGTWS